FLRTITAGEYPIKPGFAVIGHLIPVYNFYWVCRWPIGISQYVRSPENQPILNGAVAASVMLGSVVVGRAFDGGMGIAGIYIIMTYITLKLRKYRALTQN